MQKKIENDIRVNAIAECIEKGDSTGKILAEFATKWNVTNRTIGNYIALARELVTERNQAKQGILEAVRKDAIALAENKKIMSDLELEEQLCAIARGEMVMEKTIIQNGIEKTIRYKPSHFDMILAIDKLWKKRGSYPVEKKQVENQTLVMQYNLMNPGDIKYIEGV
ncbi:MAG TPA: hypothetical protein VNZ45_11915 [Bacteroidia bacterium]|jgi:hypothetical protein|nr:hypothetical protein [Bacteroidia bacterium]